MAKRFRIVDLITRTPVGEADSQEDADLVADAYNRLCQDSLAAEIIDTEEELGAL